MRRVVGRAIALGLACGVALVTKFTGVLVVPIVALLLVGRALTPRAWTMGRREREAVSTNDNVARESRASARAAEPQVQTGGFVEDPSARVLSRDDGTLESSGATSCTQPVPVGAHGLRTARGTRRAFARTLLETRGARLVAAFAVLAVVGVVSYATLWATYRFRYDATPGGEIHFELRRLADEAMIERAKQRDHVVLTREQVALDLPCRVILALGEHKLVPEAYLGGFLHAYAQSMYRATYVLGTPGAGGVWWYFPFALMVKEPIATVVAALLAVIVAARRVMRAGPSRPGIGAGRPGSSEGIIDAWTIACLIVPPAVVLLAAMRVNLNIGVRHVFAIYPFAFIAIGLALAPTLTRAGRGRKVFAGIVAVALAAESLGAWPDFISFFNVAAGGQRGGLALLGDSNLDWGQDVPALVAWQRVHPDRTLTLAYFGTDDPRARGLRYRSLIDDGSGEPPEGLPTHGVVAISATMLQNRWDDPVAARFFGSAKQLPPTEVLGGSIYLYDLGGN